MRRLFDKNPTASTGHCYLPGAMAKFTTSFVLQGVEARLCYHTAKPQTGGSVTN